MKIFLAGTFLALSSATTLIFAQLIAPLYDHNQHHFDQEDNNLDQIPIELGFGWHDPHMQGNQPNGPPLLSDILGIDRSLSIFAGLGRSVESIVISIFFSPLADLLRLLDWPMRKSTQRYLLLATLHYRVSIENRGRTKTKRARSLDMDQRIRYGVRK